MDLCKLTVRLMSVVKMAKLKLMITMTMVNGVVMEVQVVVGGGVVLVKVLLMVSEETEEMDLLVGVEEVVKLMDVQQQAEEMAVTVLDLLEPLMEIMVEMVE